MGPWAMDILYYINVHMHIHTYACMPPVGSAEQSAGPRLRSHAGAWPKVGLGTVDWWLAGMCVYMHMHIDII